MGGKMSESEKKDETKFRPIREVRYFLHFVIKKVIAVRMRYLAGDPDLKPKGLDLLHTDSQFDRIYLGANPFRWFSLGATLRKSPQKGDWTVPDLKGRAPKDQ